MNAPSDNPSPAPAEAAIDRLAPEALADAPASSRPTAKPRLRLVGPSLTTATPPGRHRATPATSLGRPGHPDAFDPISEPADPRWVLAVRAAEQLQGAILTPDRRERLVRLGQVLGLSPFDANLVIAVIQHQARRGYPAEHCPTAAEPQLRMIPRPSRPTLLQRLQQPAGQRLAALIVLLATIELAVLWFIFHLLP